MDWFREQLRSQKPVIGEKTPELIYCDDCAPRIKEVCPNAKFILCLRDPIKRFVFGVSVLFNISVSQSILKLEYGNRNEEGDTLLQ